MALTRLKYQHSGARSYSVRRRVFIFLTAALTLVLIKVEFMLAVFAAFFCAGAWLGAPKVILLGPRYLICHRDIIYFANVVKIEIAKRAGQLTLVSNTGHRIVIERDKIATNARKAHKIERNREAKFQRLSEKIIQRIQQVQPAAEFEYH